MYAKILLMVIPEKSFFDDLIAASNISVIAAFHLPDPRFALVFVLLFL